jgi:hypothetical protein
MVVDATVRATAPTAKVRMNKDEVNVESENIEISTKQEVPMEATPSERGAQSGTLLVWKAVAWFGV